MATLKGREPSFRRTAARWVRRGVPVALGVGAVLAAGAFYLPSPAPATFEAVPVALVLSGDVDYLRVAQAAALQRARRVDWIVVTGAGVGGDNGATLAQEAIKRGGDPKRIIAETRSRSTRENILDAAPLLRAHGWRRVALVTSRRHMFRALHTARCVMPEVEWLPVPVPDPLSPFATQHRLAEWRKILGYALRGWLR
jgi:uncharacterized SAM-binding protein YcdF (DUF218 family)